jgi:hypothetical protein
MSQSSFFTNYQGQVVMTPYAHNQGARTLLYNQQLPPFRGELVVPSRTRLVTNTDSALSTDRPIPQSLCAYDTNTCAQMLTQLEGRPEGTSVAGWHQHNMGRCQRACGWSPYSYVPQGYRFYSSQNPLFSPLGYPEQRLLNYNSDQTRQPYQRRLY